MSGVETSLGADSQSAVDFGQDGKPTVTTQRIDGLSMTAVDPTLPEAQEKTPLSAADIEEALAKEIEESEKEGSEGEADPQPEPSEDKSEAPPSEKVEDLGEFKADDPAVVEKFAARYFTEEGKLNEGSLTAEFWGNATKDQAGSLHESTYAYLEHQLGVSKDLVKDLEAGLVAKHQAASANLNQRVYAAAGDQATYEAAIQWASDGGYTPEQGNRLNALIQKQAEGWEDAVEALVSRFRKANPQPQARSLPPGRPQRRSTPARIAGQEHSSTKPPAAQKEAPTGDPEGGSSPAPYANADEYYADLAKANKDGTGKEMAVVRARLKASRNVWM